ncbi:hypothetical protein RA307_04860 [Xanthobacteraceae bacterium Astr-EGSB]|uniref:hypothetical protein n=1 Tax=Astrobacterium formosum TaxID=3069710 RepID=UPI0027B6AE7E|nr:hypothetical protein [Xanthobacteraceae bacterium Astr-EGSB]
MTGVVLARDRWHRAVTCPNCGHEVVAGTAVDSPDPWTVELICVGCHVTLATIEFEPLDDGDEW